MPDKLSWTVVRVPASNAHTHSGQLGYSAFYRLWVVK